MQSVEARLYKDSLAFALRRYSAAVSDMEQTVLLPSLLRDVPSDEEESCRDLYQNYLMLKAIRNAVESGPVSPEDGRADASILGPLLEDKDAEGLFRFHLTGLFSVMKDLTKRTKSLTGKYKDIIGVAH